MVWFKRLLTLALLAILIYLFLPLVKEFRNLAGVFRSAHWSWLFIALVIQVTSYAFLTGLNLILLRSFPGRVSFGQMIAILPTMAFIEVALPSAGTSGVILRARLLGKYGYSFETATFTLAMETFYIGGVILLASMMGLWYLIRAGEINTTQILVLVILTIIIISAVGGLVLFSRDRMRIKQLILQLNATTNRWLKKVNRPTSPDAKLIQRVDEFYNGLEQMRKQPGWLNWLTALGRVSLDVASLWACFLAFQYSISFGVLLTGYGLMLLASGLAALPGGLGMADLSLSVIYARLGAPGAIAIAAALAYRLIAWWLLRFVGFISWQILEARHA